MNTSGRADISDPFDTARLRSAVLAAWRDSPTRLREDAAAEADLVRAGYRDRLLTELAQNAADAAAAAGVPGRLVIRFDGRTLSVSNTGAPVDISGVHAMTALRASGKTDISGTVGRFGVGFTAVLTVSDDIELRSTSGSLHFSRARTRDALRRSGISVPEGPAAADFAPPVLRLAWPVSVGPVPGADTEVVLRLRDEVDVEHLTAAMRREAVDLLVELPALHSIRIGSEELVARTRDLDARGASELRISGFGAERTWWQFRTEHARWLLPVRDGTPVPAAQDVLRAPTRSDEELSLPALLVVDIPMQPDRRRLLPGARLDGIVAGYADFARALPPEDRLVLVPAPGFARSEVDGLLREAIVRELREHSWLPVVVDESGMKAGGIDGSDSSAGTQAAGTGPTEYRTAVPTRASVFPDITPELAELLAGMVGPLVPPSLSGRRYAEALSVLDVHRLGLARIAELSGGLDRPPRWWYALYAALEPFVGDPLAVEELGALAVPLADGRLVTGPRTVVLDDRLREPVPVHWARLAHPEAVHPLLARLGSRQATVRELLTDPGLRAELIDRPGDPETVDAVLRLAASTETDTLPDWLGLLEIPDSTGGLRPADELLLPDAPLAELLIPDSPLGTVDADIVDRYGAAALRAVGVGWDFGIVSETDPTGPDHQLDDEDAWWAGLSEDPPELTAVRDLDLVDDDSWPEALWRLLSGDRTRASLADRDGYTAWWLRRYARVDGIPLGRYRHPGDIEFAGLLPELPIIGLSRADLDVLRSSLADPEAIDPDLAVVLLEALADPARTPAPETVSLAHARLSAVVPRLDLTAVDPPDRVRALSGAVIDAADALVLDRPCFGLAVPPDRLVVGDPDSAAELATLLDLPLASESVAVEILGAGHETTWSDEPLGVVVRRMFALPAQDGPLVLHDDLRVRLHGAVRRTVSVPWWQDGTTTHLRRPRPEG